MKSSSGCGCIGAVVVVIINLWLGTMSVQYLVAQWMHQPIAWGWAMLIGLFGGELTIPAAVITWLLRAAGVH